MTSLGLLQYSEINESSTINGNLNEIEKNRQSRHNITIKKRPTTSTSAGSTSSNDNGTASGEEINEGMTGQNGQNGQNVQNMLKLINSTNGYDDADTNGGLADFNPPPRAEVSSKLSSSARQVGIDYEKPTTVLQSNKQVENPLDNNATAVRPREYPAPMDSPEGFSSLPKTYASDYYKQYVPYFNQTSNQSNVNNRDQLLEKLNYMIHLLEEQKDEKTGHVMEEVILYSFLGVFIIFIVDSFARAGKYTR